MVRGSLQQDVSGDERFAGYRRSEDRHKGKAGPGPLAARKPVRVWRLATLLTGAVIAALLPSLGLGALTAWQLTESYRAAAEGRLRDTASAIASAVSNNFSGDIEMLMVLATSPGFADPANPDLQALYAQARRAAEAIGGYINLTRRDGTQLFNTSAPLGPPLPATASGAAVERVFETGRPAIGDLVTGSASHLLAFSAEVPIRGPSGDVLLVEAVHFGPDRLQALLTGETLPPGAFAALLDSARRVVARSHAYADQFIGQSLPPDLTQAMAGQAAGVVRGSGPGGVTRVFAFHSVPGAPGWTLVVGEAAESFASGWEGPVVVLSLGGALILLVAGGLAFVTTRRILRPVEALVRHARDVAADLSGASPSFRPQAELPPANIAEVEELRLSFAAAETALRNIDVALAESEARYRTLAAATREGVAIHDGERIIDVNDCYWQTFGYASREEVIGRPLTDVIAPEAQAEVEARIRDEYAEAYEAIGCRHDGNRFPIEIHGGTVLYQGRDVRVKVIRDLTRQKADAAALRESEQRWRTMAEALPQPITVRGPDGTLEYRNAAWYEFTGQPEGSAGDLWQDMLHPDDRPRVTAAWEQALAAGAAFDEECRFRRADGEYRVVLASARPLRDANGQIVRWIGMITDVSDIAAARETISREAAHLEELAERRAVALAETQVRLAEAARMEALGRLAGGIAHDFNNVLQTVEGRLDFARRLLEREPESARRHLDQATRAAERGAAVTGRLLTFARRGALRAEPVDPGPMLDGLGEMLRPTLGTGIEIRVDSDPDIPSLLADRGQLEAVLVNLANNAADAMPAGGMIIFRAEQIQSDSPTLPPTLAGRPFIRISVSDEGQGMPPDVFARITEPFFTTKPKGKGTGLGLAMARGFAEQSGGALTIESEVDQGTIVNLWLPAVDDQPLPAAQAQAAPVMVQAQSSADCRAVLLVEDQADVRELLAAELEERGFTVMEAENAAAALFLIERGLRPDVLVTDLAMPGAMDGLALAAEVRTRHPRLPTVLITGHMSDTSPDRLEEGHRSGPFALVRKPAAADVLIERVNRVLE